LTVFVIKLFLP